MISVKDALNIILSSIKPQARQVVGLLDSLDRVLACNIRAKQDLPSFDNSAMDGYAVRAKDTIGAGRQPKILKVIEDVPAGYVARRKVGDGQAIRIMTGAALPGAADSVVMVEFTEKVSRQYVRVFKEAKPGENVRKAGEDVRKGQSVLAKGILIRPQELGMFAALGISKVMVAKRPRVGILATGDELVDITEKMPAKGKIRSTNSFILYGQIAKCGGIPVDLGIAKDTKGIVKAKIMQGLRKDLDMLLVVGGISVGDYDLVKDVLAELGMKMKFWKVAMRPGKPLAFGLINGIPVFGLPGNPVSSSIVFEEFVRPSILKMQAARHLFRPMAEAVLEEDIYKKKGFMYFIRARLKTKDGKFFVRPTGPQGSGIISSLVLADAVIVAPERAEVIKEGQTVDVQLLRHGYDACAI